MRIVLGSVHPRLLSGQIDSLIGLGRQLERLGHQVDLVTAFEPTDLSVTGRRRPRAIVGSSLPGKLVRIFDVLRRVARAGRDADVVHLALPTPAFSLLGDLLQTMLPVPVVVGFEAHLVDRDAFSAGRLCGDPGFYLPRVVVNNRLVARLALRSCPAYIVSTDCQRQELLRLGLDDDRIAVVPNLLDADKLRRWGRDEARMRLHLPEGPIVAYAGHYHHVKGVDVLVDAFAAVAGSSPGVRLALGWSGVGDGPRIDRAIDRLRLDDRVIRLGRVDVSALIAAADVFVLPYRSSIGQQALPNLLLEAMYVGVPLVTTDLPLWRDLVSGAALLVAPEDSRALAGAIGEMLAAPEAGRDLVRRQRLLMDGVLAPRMLARRYLDVYDAARQAELLRAPGGQPIVRPAAIRWPEWSAGEPEGANARGRPAA